MNDLLRASNISFTYDARPALRDVSLTLTPGELIVIIGPNGSGKSTLIRSLLGQHDASGSIEWDGRAISTWRRRDLARRVAYLPQTPTADPDQTVEQILRLGRAPYWQAFGIESEHDHRVVGQIASMLQLSDLLSRPIADLSGGQRQRVFVGRCLVQEPAAMLLDEPSTFLDLRHQIDLMRLLRSLTRERSLGVLMASHDLNLAGAFATQMILLHDGAIAAHGSPRDVLTSAALGRAFEVELDAIDRPGAPIVVPRI
jgi:iron complex transport system ATP-binding protein